MAIVLILSLIIFLECKMTGTTTKIELQERVKELSCLYDISSVIRSHVGEVSISLKKIAEVLTKAWRFSDDVVVVLEFEDFQYNTKEIPESHILQEAPLVSFGEVRGSLRIYYPSPDYDGSAFLKEEEKLLKKVADEIGSFVESIEQKKQEEVLRRTIERNDRLSILGEITAGIAHELNTPLGNILGFAELIKDREDNEQTKRDLEKIIKASIYSREVVKKLMFFACEMPQKMKVIMVYPVVTQALSLLKPNFKKAEIDFSLKMEDKNIEARVDPIQFTQILFNLLINALYFAPKRSLVTIKIWKEQGNLLIEIADKGPGIEDEIKNRIFEPFFTTKPVGEGSGLGLSVVHGIVKSHKGSIYALDNHPKGTVFRINLPLTI